MIYYDFDYFDLGYTSDPISFFPNDIVEKPFIILKYGNRQNCLRIEIKLDIKIIY